MEFERIIGKAKLNQYVFYLIKWKENVNRQISWQPTKTLRNMAKYTIQFNEKIKNKKLPFVQEQFRLQGLQLLRNLDEKKQEQKKNIKVERIIGKCYLNNEIHYFIKWKDHSIFESDWISKVGLWCLYRKELKEFNKKVVSFNLPCLDKNSFEEYLKIQRFAFLNDPRFKSISDFLSDKRTKREKLIDKKVKKQQNVKTEYNQKSNEEIISDLIIDLREKFYRPIQNLYIPTQRNGIKNQEHSDSTTQFFDSNSILLSQQNQLRKIEQSKSQTLINQSLRKNRNNDEPQSEQEFEVDSSESSECDSQDAKIKARNQTKKQKSQLKQNQIFSKSQNDFSFRPQENYHSKLEPLEFSQDNSLTNIMQINKNYSFGFEKTQEIKQDHLLFPKEILFELDGKLSQTVTFDNQSFSKSYDSLSHRNHNKKMSKIFQQISQYQKYESQTQKQARFSTFISNQHKKFHQDSSSSSLINSFENSRAIYEDQIEKKVRKIVVIQKKSEIIHQAEHNLKDQEINQLEKTENTQKIISIRLFAEDISSLQNSGQKQNLYEVIFARPSQITQTLKSQRNQAKSQYSENPSGDQNFKERRFLETSYLKKHYNSEFLNFLEQEIGRLRKQK